MGICGSSCHKYDSIIIRKTKVVTYPDGRREEHKETTHQRDIINGELVVEDLM